MYYDQTAVKEMLQKLHDIAFTALTVAYKQLSEEQKAQTWDLVMNQHADTLDEIRAELGIELCSECGELLDECTCEDEQDEDQDEEETEQTA